MDESGGQDVKTLHHASQKGIPRYPLFLLMLMKTLLICLSFLLLSGVAQAGGEKRTEVPVGDSPALGPADAPVTIVEFIDFQ